MQPTRLKYLYDRYLAATITTAEYEELAELINNNDVDEQLHDLIKATWNTVSQHKQPRDKADRIFQHIISQQPDVETRPNRSIWLIKRFAVAASVILLAGIGWFFLNKESAAPLPSKNIVAKTPTQTHRYIQLPDGSRVVLNHGSTLTYSPAFNGATREVYLTGEAYFDIAHMNNRPFIVHTGSVQTTVLGTAFNINAYQKNIIVTVTRGKVKVEDKNRAVAIITPNEQVIVNTELNNSSKQTVNAVKVTEWKQKELVFDDASMEEIALALEMQFNVSVVFENASYKKYRVTATFRNGESLEDILKIITKVNDMQYVANGKEIKIFGD